MDGRLETRCVRRNFDFDCQDVVSARAESYLHGKWGESLRRICFIILMFSVLLAGCTGQGETASEEEAVDTAITFTDDLGRSVTLEPPERVAALIGSFADIWCLSGGKETLVAAANDAWTSFALGLGEQVANLGAVTQPNLEVLINARPDLILASCNTAADVELRSVLEQAGLTVAYFDVQNVDDYLRMLDVCTQLTGCVENYTRYGVQVQAQTEAAMERQDGSAPSVLCIRATGSSVKVKGSTDNVLGEMLGDLGCVNIADSDGALLESLSLEAIIAADPEYIFVVVQGSDPTDAQALLDATLLSNPAWSGLRAVREGRFHTLDHSLYNLKPNARWGEAYEKLADILYSK